MPRPWMGYLAGAAFALTAAGAAAAYAQAAPPAPPAPGGHEHGQRIERQVIIRDGDGRVSVSRDGGERHVMIMRHDGAERAEHLRTMLQLKPSQEAALTAYLAALTPAAHHEHVVEMSDHAAHKTTPQRLAEMEARMAEDTARSKAHIEATRKFYDQLEPSQKKVFDEMPMLMMGGMHMMDGMKVMVNMEGMPPMPPLPPLPPRPPRAPTPPAPRS